MTMIRPYIDPTRPRQKRRPLKALYHARKLIADKEDTTHVFEIFKALNGDSHRRDFARFLKSERGLELLLKHRHLPDIFDNHAWLSTLPADSVGRAYHEFMTARGLSAAEFVAESEVERKTQPMKYDDDLHWYKNRARDTHDLFHVLTGYDRDALGEAALLGFTHSQTGGLGINFITIAAKYRIARLVPSDARIGAVIAEARRCGRNAKRIIDEDIVALLKEPLDSARKRLNIAPLPHYEHALEVFRAHAIDPYKVAA